MENNKKLINSIAKSTDGYGNVRNAILTQAIYDYKKALKSGNKNNAATLEKWFLSEWGELLSGNKGAYIISQVRKEIKNNAKC